MTAFIRQIEVLVGPLEEGQKGNIQQALRIFSDGSPNGLRISFHVQKSIISVPNVSMITFYNLDEDTRAALGESQKQIIVNAGWAGTGKLPMIFIGGIVAVVTERQGPNMVTRVMALTMGDVLSRSVASLTFKSGRYVVDCLLDLMQRVDGVTVDKSAIRISKDKVGNGGISFAGQIKDILDAMARQYGFSWSIQDGVFQAVGDHSSLTGEPVLLDGRGGSLISLSPLLTGPLQMTRGVRIRTVIQPGITVGKQVTVINSVTPGLDNDYKVHVLDYHGDTYTDDWFMDIQSLFTF